MQGYDVVIIGSGAGGGTLAHALSGTGARILLVERGDFLPVEPENWSPRANLLEHRYADVEERWEGRGGRPFAPLAHYWVGGQTKVYGGVLLRMRAEDFAGLAHAEGRACAWPFAYEDIEPYYQRAEELYLVHGQAGEDPTEPPRSRPFPHPAIPHEPCVGELAGQLAEQGLSPYHLPLAYDVRPGGACVRCNTCDSFPCYVQGKADAELRCVRPALARGVELWTRARAVRIVTDASGRRAAAVEIERQGARVSVGADLVVVSCGAIHSAALLLRSACARHPRGLANGSDLVGRNLMAKVTSYLVAIRGSGPNPAYFQKTLGVNDLYLGGGRAEHPLGAVQLVHRAQAAHYLAAGVDRGLAGELARSGVEMVALTECLPDPENRVTVGPSGEVRVCFAENNLSAHGRLVAVMKEVLSAVGFARVLDSRSDGEAAGLRWTAEINPCSHVVGTVRAGHDPATSVVDPWCRAHEVENLYVVDASIFPSQGAVNSALTVIANALRVADHVSPACLRDERRLRSRALESGLEET